MIMQFRCRGVLPLAALCTSLAMAPALAAKPDPVRVGTPTGKRHGVQVGTATRASTVCHLGVYDVAVLAYGYIQAPDDAYFTLIDPAACSECGGAGVRLTSAHMQIFFTEACQIPVTVSVTPAITLAPGCYAPDP